MTRDAERTLGLYLDHATAPSGASPTGAISPRPRRLAENARELAAGLDGAALIHVSGITLAIIGAEGRRRLIEALGAARQKGAIVSFDPNLRRRLWRDEAELRDAMIECLKVSDVALPSYDDERELWGDLCRRRARGVSRRSA